MNTLYAVNHAFYLDFQWLLGKHPHIVERGIPMTKAPEPLTLSPIGLI